MTLGYLPIKSMASLVSSCIVLETKHNRNRPLSKLNEPITTAIVMKIKTGSLRASLKNEVQKLFRLKPLEIDAKKKKKLFKTALRYLLRDHTMIARMLVV